MASDYRDRGRWDDDDDNRRERPSGGGVGPSSIAYESGRRRSGRRRLIILAVVVLVAGGFAGILWNAYDSGQQSGGEGVVPLIQAENSPTKVRPAQPGGIDVPNQDKLIYERLTPGQTGAAPVERLLPPPESPVARPEPPAAAQAPESLLPEIPPDAPAPAATEPEPPMVATRPTPAQVPSETARPAAPAKPPAPRQTASVPPPAAAPSGGMRIQLGAVRTRDGAQQEWAKLQKAHKDLLGALGLNVTQANLASGTFYRIQAGPVGDQAAANDLCAKLKARNVSCIIVK